MKKIFALILITIIINEYESTGGQNGQSNQQQTNNKTPQTLNNNIMTSKVYRLSKNNITYDPKVHEEILRSRNQNTQYKLDHEIPSQNFIKKNFGNTKVMDMDEIRAKLQSNKSFEGLTKANSPVKAIHFQNENQSQALTENDKKIQIMQQKILENMIRGQMKTFMDPSSSLAKQELQFSKIVQQIRGFSMYIQQLVEKHSNELDIKSITNFQRIIFKLTPMCDTINVVKINKQNSIGYQYHFIQSHVNDLRQELENQLALLTEKCYYFPQYLLCKIHYKDQLTNFTVMTDLLKPVEDHNQKQTRYKVFYMKEDVDRQYVPALAAFYNQYGDYSIYELTQAIRSSELRYMLIDIFSTIEVSLFRKNISTQFIAAIQNCFSYQNINVHLVPLNSSLDYLKVQYAYLKEKIIKFIFELRKIEKIVDKTHGELEDDFKMQSQNIIDYLGQLESNSVYYLDNTSTVINNKNLDENPYQNIEKIENYKIDNFMLELNKMTDSILYPEFLSLQNLINDMINDQEENQIYITKLRNLLEISVHAFSKQNIVNYTSKNKKKKYNIYNKASFISFIQALNDLDGFYFKKNIVSIDKKDPNLLKLRPILDQLLVNSGRMDIQKDKVIEKMIDIKQNIRKLYVLEILQCKECMTKNYTKNFKNQIK